jgi:hypothetical protein
MPLQKESIVYKTALSCSVFVPIARQDITVSTTGEVLAPVQFTSLLVANKIATIEEVKVAGTRLINPSILPSQTSQDYSVIVPINAVGTSTLELFISSEEQTASCRTEVTATPVVAPAPVITEFTISPSQIVYGGSAQLNLAVTGAVTSVQINGESVQLVQGRASIAIAPKTIGLVAYEARVQGPGGSITQSKAVDIRPLCMLQARQSTAMVGTPAAFDVSINSGAQGTLSGTGIQTTFLATEPDSLSEPYKPTSMSVSAMVLSAAGNQPITLSVSVNGRTATCQDSVNLIASNQPPAPSCTMTPSFTQRFEGNSFPIAFQIVGNYNNATISANGLQTVEVRTGTSAATTFPTIITGTGMQTIMMRVFYGSNNQSTTCTASGNFLPITNPPVVSLTMDGSSSNDRYFLLGQTALLQWSSSGADSCEFTQIGLNLPDSLSGSRNIDMSAAQTVVLKCSRNTSDGQISSSASLGWGIALPLCYLGVPQTPSTIGSRITLSLGLASRFISNRSSFFERATITGANISPVNLGATQTTPPPPNFGPQIMTDATIVANSANKTITAVVTYAPGVTATCTASLP